MQGFEEMRWAREIRGQSYHFYVPNQIWCHVEFGICVPRRDKPKWVLVFPLALFHGRPPNVRPAVQRIGPIVGGG